MIRIDNALIWTGERLEALSLLLEGEKITGLVEPRLSIELPADQVVDAQDCWVLPGGVDLHVHVSDGAETFFPGSCCAAAGGITTVFDMAPFHACVTASQFKAKVKQAEREMVTDFGLVAGIVINEEDLENLEELARLGAAYFKVFMPSDPPVSARTLWKAAQTAAHTGLRMGLHAEETACLESIYDWNNPLAFPHSRPAVVESCAVAQLLEMARAAGAPVHICHVSAGRTTELIADAIAHGVDVTAETAAHYLVLDETAFAEQGPRVKTTPPLRTQLDNQALWQALAEGVIDAIASDHYTENLQPAPRDPALIEKAAAGIAGLELSLPLIFSYGVQAGRISLQRFVQAVSLKPAQIANVDDRKGRITPGYDADLTLWDPLGEWSVGAETTKSQGIFSRVEATPYVGWELRGRIRQTWLRGQCVWDGQNIQAQPGQGQWIASRS